MAKNIHSNYYEDNYVKVECQDCKRCFIVGEKLSEGMELSCPYCQSKSVEEMAYTDDESLDDMDMGCLGLYFHIYDDGQLMLYTENEFAEALKEYFQKSGETSIPLGAHNKIMLDYCMKRDKRIEEIISEHKGASMNG